MLKYNYIKGMKAGRWWSRTNLTFMATNLHHPLKAIVSGRTFFFLNWHQYYFLCAHNTFCKSTFICLGIHYSIGMTFFPGIKNTQ